MGQRRKNSMPFLALFSPFCQGSLLLVLLLVIETAEIEDEDENEDDEEEPDAAHLSIGRPDSSGCRGALYQAAGYIRCSSAGAASARGADFEPQARH